MSVLVYIENTEGSFKKSALEVLSYAKAVADSLSEPLLTLSIGTVDSDQLNSLGNYGARDIISVQDPALSSFTNQAYASVIAQITQQEQPEVVILSNSANGKELAPRLAAKLEAALANGVVGLPQREGTRFIVKKTAFSGKAFAITELTSPIKILALTPNSFELKEHQSEITVRETPYIPSNTDQRIHVEEILRSSSQVPLSEASIVVSGGRGLKGPENWTLVEALAEALGAATACSKPVSDAGWRPHAEHVGQTGITISPDIYIAIGISGAIQHLAGVNSSKIIVVINKDPEAPFFKVADYGIVGDAFEILPKLTDAIKAYQHK